MCVPRVFSLIMVRDSIEWFAILTAVSGDDAYNMRVRAHSNHSIPCGNASPSVVSDNTGEIVGPMVEVES